MHKLIINLHNKYKKLVHTYQELEKVNLNDITTRIIACNEVEAKTNGYKYLTPKAYANIKNLKSTVIIPNYRALACAMSHIKCWKYIIDNNIEDCLIIEDDVEITDIELFKINYNNINEIIKKNKNNKALFITMNSKLIELNDIYDDIYNSSGILINKYNDGKNIYYKENIKQICNVFTRTHFYYVNNKMAKIFYNELNNIDYQIDIEIGLLAKKYRYYYDKLFLNIQTNSIIQSKNFISSVQFYNITINEIISIFNINYDVASLIYDNIPDIYKKKKEDNNINNINRNNRNNLIDNITYIY